MASSPFGTSLSSCFVPPLRQPLRFRPFFFGRVLPSRFTHLDVQPRGSRDACGTRHAREGDLHSCVVETCFTTGSGAIPIPPVVFRVSPIKRFPIERKTNPGLCRVREPDPRPSRMVRPSHPHQRIFSRSGGDGCEPCQDTRGRKGPLVARGRGNVARGCDTAFPLVCSTNVGEWVGIEKGGRMLSR